MWEITTTLGNHKSSEENLEGQIWIVRYIENKIRKTQATLLILMFIIPGDTSLTNFYQVSSYMYAALFGITHDPSGNPYLVTKLVPMRLGYTFLPFYRNITGPFTPDTLSTQGTVTENLESLQFFHGRVYLCLQEPLGHPYYNGSSSHPTSIEINDKNE